MGVYGSVFIFCFCTVCYCTTDFYNLLGYEITGTIMSTVATSDDITCAETCAKNSSCLGFYLEEYSASCNLLSSITGLTQDDTQCTYYVKDSNNVEIAGATLNFIDQLYVNILYASKQVCPDGWTQGTTTCSSTATDSVSCYLLPSALDATWNGTACVVPIMQLTYNCSSGSSMYNVTGGVYCYLTIPQAVTTVNGTGSNATQRYGYYNNLCYEQTNGGNLVSIHSDAENDIIDGLGRNFIIGLIAVSGKVTSAADMSWIDGTKVDYTNYTSGAPDPTSDFYFTIFESLNNWVTNYTTIPADTQLACRVAATLILTKT